jgi:putative nucleotidyltransferase with HDIG domain
MNAAALHAVATSADLAGVAPAEKGLSHSARLLMALDAVDRLPVLSEARREFVALADRPAVTDSRLVGAIAAEPALAAALLRFANRYGGGTAATPQAALAHLGRGRAVRIARELPAFALGGRPDAWIDEVSRFRAHGLRVSRIARRIARELGDTNPEQIATAALFHDVGRPVMTRVHRERPDMRLLAGTPRERVAAEQRTVGFDHAALGALVARRWSLPKAISVAIEHHHSEQAVGIAGIVRLADLLVHHTAGAQIGTAELRDAADRISLPERALSDLLYDRSSDVREETRSDEPCPLTRRQLELLRALGQGRQYKEIAEELGLATSTVRSHLHFAYERLGVSDRAQAVLLAASHGWIAPVSISAR